MSPVSQTLTPAIPQKPVLKSVSTDENFKLFQGDCLEILAQLPAEHVDMIFADPPYKLSNGGTTCYAGKRVSVNKGDWDKSAGVAADMAFHTAWLTACRRVLKPNGTIWISGTLHSIYQCGYLLAQLGFHILNDITWFKPNAAPNLSCTVFAHSHETLLWARREKKTRHTFNYKAMKNSRFPEDKLKAPHKQMRSVWSIPTPAPSEKSSANTPHRNPSRSSNVSSTLLPIQTILSSILLTVAVLQVLLA